MKKNIIGILAVIIALSASAFTVPHQAENKKFTDLKWFNISGSVAASSPTPSANATYRSGDDGPSAPTNSCAGTGKQCVSGYDASQVDPTTNMLIGTSQTPVTVVEKH
ncbi:hypothetical protein [Mucilaginibacter sp. UYCu711]|uniref:hypothetical protein n=1 Tax=Mucilaginibacter sp. UYCu711 TaxID=3156339 RepID=UPI003D1CD6CE